MTPEADRRAEIENEANNGLKNDNYTVAMARTSAPHSATAQFFINVADNGFLNHTAPTAQGWGYAVFGKVVGGTDVVDRIKAVKTGRKGFHDDVPHEDVVIEKAVVTSNDACSARPHARPCRLSRSCVGAAARGARSTSFPTCTCRPAEPATFDAWRGYLRDHAGRRGLHPRRPVRGVGRRRRGRRARLRGRSAPQVLRAAGAAPAGVLHARQPRLPGRRRHCAARCGVTLLRRPDGAGAARRALAAEPRRRAVPGRHRLPAVPRAGAHARMAAGVPGPAAGGAPRHRARDARAKRGAQAQPGDGLGRRRHRRRARLAARRDARTLIHGHTHRPADARPGRRPAAHRAERLGRRRASAARRRCCACPRAGAQRVDLR